jgi:hypothetical protein
MNNLIDNPLHQNFVSPWLCKDLNDLGLTSHTIYQWKVRLNTTDLFTVAFDIDRYYVDAVKHIDHVNPPLDVMPAYSTKDVEKCLPHWLMTFGQNGYEVSLDQMFGMESKTAQRMPDAFAMLLKEMMMKGKIDVIKANRILSTHLNQL